MDQQKILIPVQKICLTTRKSCKWYVEIIRIFVTKIVINTPLLFTNGQKLRSRKYCFLTSLQVMEHHF